MKCTAVQIGGRSLKSTMGKVLIREKMKWNGNWLTNTGTFCRMPTALAIKTIPLKFQDKERTMFYLFLTTHDPTGALSLNEILDEEKIREYDLRFERRNMKSDFVQTSMFNQWGDPARPVSNDPNPDDVGMLIYMVCKGQKIKYREVLRRLINSPYYHSDIRKAMSSLKRQYLVQYERLQNDEIT